MNGNLQAADEGEFVEITPLAPWEALAIDSVGSVIEFWGFKFNHGRVWTLLYLRGRAFTAAEIQQTLGLSKGAVSMVTRELEQWKVLHRVRTVNESSWRFAADIDFKAMISRVIVAREASFVAKVIHDLREAERQAAAAGNEAREPLERIRRMRLFAEAFGMAVETFVATARFDVVGLGEILVGGLVNVVQRRLM